MSASDKQPKTELSKEGLSIGDEQKDLGAKLFLVASIVQKKYLSETCFLTVFGPAHGCYWIGKIPNELKKIFFKEDELKKIFFKEGEFDLGNDDLGRGNKCQAVVCSFFLGYTITGTYHKSESEASPARTRFT